MATYAGSDGVDNVSTTALDALASIGYGDGHLGIFVKDLLNATIVATRFPHWLRLTSLFGFFMLVDSAGIQAVPKGWLFILAAGSRSVRRLKASVCSGISLS